MKDAARNNIILRYQFALNILKKLRFFLLYWRCSNCIEDKGEREYKDINY